MHCGSEPATFTPRAVAYCAVKPAAAAVSVAYSAHLGGYAFGFIVALALLWSENFSDPLRWTLTVGIVLCWLGFSFAVRGAVVRPLQTLSNMQSALREGGGEAVEP